VPTVINGLPAHVLLIHVVVILVPLGALFTVLSAVWPAARRKLGFISPLTCLIALIFVPITTHAGEWLRDRLRVIQHGESAALTKHANLGDTFLWFAIALFVVSAGVYLVGRKYDLSLRPSTARDEKAPSDGGTGGGTATATRTQTETRTEALPQWASIVVAVIAVVVSAVVTWQLYRVGDAGAHATWNGVANSGS
jgi:hypothetical protein